MKGPCCWERWQNNLAQTSDIFSLRCTGKAEKGGCRNRLNFADKRLILGYSQPKSLDQMPVPKTDSTELPVGIF